jgi:Na+-transporting methylmalonyl-CoA/oxaloacetate decarboxylase gamma subunit
MKPVVRIIVILGALAVIGWLVSRIVGRDEEAMDETETVLAEAEEVAEEVAEELAEVTA